MNKQDKIRLYNLKKKNPVVACWLSIAIVGGGQLYNGQAGKGVLHLLFCVLSWIVMMGWVWWIISPVDAYKSAKKLNEALMIELNLKESDVKL